jgi:hypothetical protein
MEMNAQAKQDFIREIIAHVQNDILAAVPNMPEEWDGHELRRFIADKFDHSAMTVGRKGFYGRDYRQRTRAYRNEVLVRNL